MKTFSDILPGLENVDHLQCIELLDAEGEIVGMIENKPGSQGSLKVYHALWKKWGCINSDAASEGLALYAENTEDAENHPGKHPNIDRLFGVIADNSSLTVETVPVGLS